MAEERRAERAFRWEQNNGEIGSKSWWVEAVEFQLARTQMGPVGGDGFGSNRVRPGTEQP